MNNFLTRSITALFFAIASVAAIYHEHILQVYFLVFCSIGLKEYYSLLGNKKRITLNQVYVLLGIASFVILSMVQLNKIDPKFSYIPILFLAFVFINELYLKSDKPFEEISIVLSSFIYIVLPFFAFTSLGYINGTYNFEVPMGMLFLIWANDTGAYLFGITLGKHRLFERISPKKSWEGFVGGMLIAVIVSYIISLYFLVLSPLHWISIALIVVVFGTLGDLLESMLKRSKGVKDSGAILPGHGGALDRFDGLLLAAPMVYLYLHLFL